MFNARRSFVLLTAASCFGTLAHAQTQVKEPHKDSITLSISYDTLGGKTTNTSSFGTQGGAVEFNYSFLHGFGATASALGLHADSIGSGVPVNLILTTFGPSYTYTSLHRAHPLSLFAHGLVGVVDGFDGLYPQGSSGSTTSASSLAFQTGGGIDVSVSRHVAVRLVQVDYVRMQLPNSQSNVQNNLRLGVGIVLK